MACTDGTVKEPAHDAGGDRLVATVTDPRWQRPRAASGPISAATRAVRLGLGHTRDVSMIEGEVEVLEIDALPQQRGDRFVAHTGFDPRALATPYCWFRMSPRHIQAWREVNEMPDHELMRDGRWLSDASAADHVHSGPLPRPRRRRRTSGRTPRAG